MKLKSTLLSACVFSFLLMSCTRNTDKLIEEMEKNELEFEYNQLVQIQNWLKDKTTRHSRGDLRLFVSEYTLNEVLKAFDGTTLPIEEIENVTFKVEKIRTAFRDGLPKLDIEASANAKGWFGSSLKLVLVISALIDIPPIHPNSESVEAKVKILKIVPKIQYSYFRFDIHKVVNAIATYAGEKFSEGFPEFTISIEKQFKAEFKKEDYPAPLEFPAGTVNAYVETPEFKRCLTLNINNTLALSGGLYVYAEIIIEEIQLCED